MLHVDKHFINLVSGRLPLFKWKSNNLANFRCIVCGDSKTKANKTRGYFYAKKGSYFYSCHNCNVGMSLGNFLKKYDHGLYKQYLMDTFGSANNVTYYENQNPIRPERVVVSRGLLDSYPNVVDLANKHPAKMYLANRKIPSSFFSELRFCDCFATLVQETVPSKDISKMPKGDSRIVIPFSDSSGELIGFQGRSLDPKEKTYKYITIKIDDSFPKIWGLHRINQSKKIYVVEGPFDAMFLDNAVATTDSTLHNVLAEIPGKHPSDFVLVSDNEPHNKQIVGGVEGGIDRGFNVTIWPSKMEGLKDINEMILSGYSASEVQAIIDTNTYDGLLAKMNLKMWRKT